MRKFTKLIIVMVLAMVVVQVSKAQTVITGNVTSAVDGTPIEAAMVKLLAENKIVAFCTADMNGHYSITTKSPVSQLDITFERMSFKKKVVRIKNENQTLNVTLEEDAIGLKEVTVKAPSVRQHGDTLTFNIADFVSKGDLTLEDALKKIPGIEVSKSGQISYMNKSISKFYVEGLDMLGGKYVLATKNMPKEYVRSVEVMQNHNDIKMDKDNVSTDVAINIKLSNKAKLKPMGTSAVTIGYGDDLLYQAEATGMLFTKKIQSLITAKYGNVRQFSMKESNDFFNSTTLSVPASSVQGNLGGGRPPQDVDRYVNSTDGLFSANTLKKLGENTTFKVNATYAYSKTDYDYWNENSYYDPTSAGQLVITERNTPGTRVHKPVFDLEYKNNSPKNYLTNKLSIIGNFTQNTLATERNEELLDQKKKTNMFGVKNDFQTSFYSGKQKWSFSSQLAFTTSPTADMRVIGSTGEWDAMQDGTAKQFKTRESIGTTFRKGRFSFYLPIEIKYIYDDSRVSLTRKDDSDVNHVYSNDLSLSSSMRLEYKTADNRWKFALSPTFTGVFYDQKNSSTALSINKGKFIVSPFGLVTWNATAMSAFTLSGGMTESYGDVVNMFNAPVLTNYRNITVRSGLMNDQKQYMANLSHDFTSVQNMLWINTALRYTHSKNNVMNESSIDETMMIISQRLAPSKSDNVLAQIDLTKQVMSISSKFRLRLYYRWNQSESIRNEEFMKYKNYSFGIQPRIDLRPLKWMEINYDGSIVKQINSYSGTERNFWSQDHSIKLKLYPAEGLEINSAWDFMRKSVADNQYKSFSLIDFGANYTYKRIRYSFKINNILNTKHYSYTTFNDMDYFKYDFNLRGREFLFSVSFTQ